ncbi:MAG: HAMP domain-containing sensor histidine kinase [Oscillospiraceae bacterium]
MKIEKTIQLIDELPVNKVKIKKVSRFLSLRFFLVIGVVAIVLTAALLTYFMLLLLQVNGVFDTVELTETVVGFLALVACLFVATAIAYVASHWILKPMDDIIAATQKVSVGDFSARVSTKGCYGDVKNLVQSFDDMLVELSGIEMFKEDFINNFSHEFKTPIVSIRGFAEQLRRDDITEEQRREYAGLIVSESEKLTNMSSSVLLLTKLQTQEMVGEKTRYSLDEQLRESLLCFQREWEEKNIEPVLSFPPTAFYGNPKMLEHVWSNLFSNAIKFTNEGGTIKISCRKAGNFVEVKISDNGIGMDELTIKHIFEKFYQGDTAHSFAGNGLGLPIAKRIVELNGGNISVVSIKGEGTTFLVRLPLDEQR